MVIFIDTSSLIKRYVSETGSDIIDSLFNDENEICISPVTVIEMRSALGRKLRDGSIDSETYQKAIDLWSEEYISFIKISFDDSLVIKAIKEVEDRGVKTLDSIQIGSALLSMADEMVTSDQQMFRVFQAIKGIKSRFI